jgi:hypothetical protein
MEAYTGLPPAFPSFAFKPACIGKNVPDNDAMIIQNILFIDLCFSESFDFAAL